MFLCYYLRFSVPVAERDNPRSPLIAPYATISRDTSPRNQWYYNTIALTTTIFLWLLLLPSLIIVQTYFFYCRSSRYSSGSSPDGTLDSPRISGDLPSPRRPTTASLGSPLRIGVESGIFDLLGSLKIIAFS